MATREPAHPLEKRALLHADPVNKGKVNEVAEAMLRSGRAPEAVDYIEVTRDPALLNAAESDAVKRGCTWLLQQVDRIRGAKSPAERWVALANAAKQAERWYDAVRALQFAGQDAEADALRAEKCPDYDPFKPLGK
jgi:hypothetical protein